MLFEEGDVGETIIAKLNSRISFDCRFSLFFLILNAEEA